ncbi:Ski complex subunit Rec14 [Cladophialophora chaetospira]|uniref:Large ribosomal subunit protein bL32m n=1 Tax=Cladophialophora chaetospira TaxID=386627 RepID=A0AA38X6U2_9EURO|nr:Ski complex subunit Rec14 [Cladophialophora chaetospira]
MALAAPFGGARLSRLLKSTGIFSTAISAWSPQSPLSASIALPAITISIPSLVSDIWEGILRAVPKKKTSHSKKRHRQLAGKALKDVKAVNQCPGCGRPKKAHTLCPYCVAEIYESWRTRDLETKQLAKVEEESSNYGFEEQRLNEVNEKR